MDLKQCMKALADPVSFQTGIHFASACSAQYFMERSTGSALPIQPQHVGTGYTSSLDQQRFQNCFQQQSPAGPLPIEVGWPQAMDLDCPVR